MCVCVCVCAYVHIPWPLVSSSSPLHPKRKQIGSDCALLPSSFFPSHLFCKPFFGKYYLIPFLYLCVFSLPLCIILLPWAKRTLSRSFMPLALAPPPQCISESVLSGRDRHLVQQKSAPYASQEWWWNGSLGNTHLPLVCIIDIVSCTIIYSPEIVLMQISNLALKSLDFSLQTSAGNLQTN